MLALYRSGRQADALHTYQEARRVLANELGLEPSHELKQLEQAILRQEPTLRIEGLVSSPPGRASSASSGSVPLPREEEKFVSPPGFGTSSLNLPIQSTPMIGRERELRKQDDSWMRTASSH